MLTELETATFCCFLLLVFNHALLERFNIIEMCSCFGGEYLPPLFHSVVVSRPAPPTEAFVNEPPSLHPSLLLNRASPYQSYITAKRSARERQKGGRGSTIWSITAMSA